MSFVYKDGWFSDVFGFPVIKKPIGDAGALPLKEPSNIADHTTQGKTDEGANQTFSADPGIGPHFTLDSDSIYQLRSVNHRAGSLKGDTTNDPYAIQIEMAAICTTKPWTLPVTTRARSVALHAAISMVKGIPLRRPNPAWKDDCSDITGIWASTSNSRRKWAASRWPSLRGVWMHLEIPGNDHWDCGALDISAIVADAALLKTGGDDVTPDELTAAVKAALGGIFTPTGEVANATHFTDGQFLRRTGAKRPEGTTPTVKAKQAGWDSENGSPLPPVTP